jgi:hypothetical protein
MAPRRFGEVLLLDLDLAALLFERGLDLLGLVPGDAFLDGLRRRVDEVLGLLEAQAGELAHDLDDRDLVGPDLGQRGGELGLLLRGLGGRGGAGGRRGTRERDGAAAVTPKRSSNFFLKSDSSRTVMCLERLEQPAGVIVAMSGVLLVVGAAASRRGMVSR